MKKSNHIISMTCLVFGLMLISLGLFVYCRNMNVMTLVVAIIPILIGITLIRIGINIIVEARKDRVSTKRVKEISAYRFHKLMEVLGWNIFDLNARDAFLVLLAVIITMGSLGVALVLLIVFGK